MGQGHGCQDKVPQGLGAVQPPGHGPAWTTDAEHAAWRRKGPSSIPLHRAESLSDGSFIGLEN